MTDKHWMPSSAGIQHRIFVQGNASPERNALVVLISPARSRIRQVAAADDGDEQVAQWIADRTKALMRQQNGHSVAQPEGG